MKTWQRLVAPVQKAIPGFTWHRLRHSFASHMMQRGARLKEVQRLMGHRSIATTAIYGHLDPGDGERAVEML